MDMNDLKIVSFGINALNCLGVVANDVGLAEYSERS